MDVEEKLIRQIEDDPTSQFKRAIYAEWLETRGRRAEIIYRELDGDLEHLICENNRAWKVRLGYLPPVPDYLALTLEVPPTGLVKQVICAGSRALTFNPGTQLEELFTPADEDWILFWRVVYHLPPLFSREQKTSGCWHLTLEHDGLRTSYNEQAREPSQNLETVCRAVDRMVYGRFGFGGRDNAPLSILEAAMSNPV